LHSYFTSGFIRTWRRSTTLSFETEGERLPPQMDAKKGKTRKESTPIKVWVTPEEKAAIATKADAHSLSASSYLRRLGLAMPLQSTIDQRAILDLVKINADLGRFGGLIKMWLTTNVGFESVSAQGLQRKLENTLSEVRQLQKKMSERLEDL
jgi:mobilization protein NikA